jgi:hypothetical protein
MSELILDRAGRLRDTPVFLAPVTARERNLLRLLLVLGGAALALVVLMVALAIFVLTPPGHAFGAAIQALAKGRLVAPGLSTYSYLLGLVGPTLLAIAIGLVGIASVVYRRPIRSFVTAAPRFRWKVAALGFAITLVTLGAAVLVDGALGGEALHPPVLMASSAQDLAIYVACAVVFLFIAALAEELVFRGWLLQQTGAFTRSLVVLLLVNGVVFSLAHGDPNPAAFVGRALMGAGWAWIALRLGGTEFGIGGHFANNLLIALFLQPVTLIPSPEQAGLVETLAQILIVGVWVGSVELLVRSGRLEGTLTRG